MPPEDDAKFVRMICDAALRLDPEERPEYLDRACADKPHLRPRVEAQLRREPEERNIDGQVIGPYILRRELGRGGMGVVYLADDTRLSRRVALKALGAGLGQVPGSRERLRLEARAAAGLAHPGIATVYALEEIGEELYLACEYVPGEPLRALLESGPLPIHQVVDIGVQLARALVAAHTQGIIHRDIKPENVIKTPSGVIKVLDFGLARMEGRDEKLTQTGVIVGTPAYLAPEQINGKLADFRTDLFALGLLLYELTSGRNPFVAKSFRLTMAQIAEMEPAPLASIRPDIAPGLEQIIMTCLRKDPLERYKSTQDAVADLEQLQAEIRSRISSGVAVNPPQPNRSVPMTPRWWWVWHQRVMSMVYILMMYPAWRARSWLEPPWGMVFLLAVLASAAAAASLRLHLAFIARNFPDELQEQQARSRLWTLSCDLAFAAVQLVAAVAINSAHPEYSMLLVAVSIVVLIAALVIEPTTARAAFGKKTATSRV